MVLDLFCLYVVSLMYSSLTPVPLIQLLSRSATRFVARTQHVDRGDDTTRIGNRHDGNKPFYLEYLGAAALANRFIAGFEMTLSGAW